jgi:hypothetical protein
VTPRKVAQIVGSPRRTDRTLEEQRPWKTCTHGEYGDLRRQYVGGRKYEARPLTIIWLRNKAVAILGHDLFRQNDGNNVGRETRS